MHILMKKNLNIVIHLELFYSKEYMKQIYQQGEYEEAIKYCEIALKHARFHEQKYLCNNTLARSYYNIVYKSYFIM